jgi:hypothetical protein
MSLSLGVVFRLVVFMAFFRSSQRVIILTYGSNSKDLLFDLLGFSVKGV